MIPDDIKNVTSLNEFKTKIKQWQPKNYTCCLHKTYVNGIGFVDVVDQLQHFYIYYFNNHFN